MVVIIMVVVIAVIIMIVIVITVVVIMVVIIMVVVITVVIIPGIPVIVAFPVSCCDFSGESIDFVFVFDAAGSEFQLINAVIQIVFSFAENSIFQTGMGKSQFTGFLNADASFMIQFRGIYSNGAGLEAAVFQGIAGAVCHIVQKMTVGSLRACFQLNKKVFCRMIFLRIKIAVCVNFTNKILDYFFTGIVFIIFHIADNSTSAFVHAFQLQNPSFIVIIHLNFRIDTDQKSSVFDIFVCRNSGILSDKRRCRCVAGHGDSQRENHGS